MRVSHMDRYQRIECAGEGSRRFSPRNARGTARGFTLIEILVVVAIIALLISILLPSLKVARDAAMTVKCVAHVKQLANASNGYLNSNKNRFCWGTVDVANRRGYPKSHYYGGATDKGDTPGGDWDGVYGPTASLQSPTNPGGYHIPAGMRPLNKYVTARSIGKDGDADLQIYHCPKDDGVRSRIDFTEPKSNLPAYTVMGTSYDVNVTWWEYVRTKEYPPASPASEAARNRAYQLMDRLAFIFEKKSASRAVIMYEDPADCTLGGVLYNWQPDLRYMGWHGKLNYYSCAFLDGHAENLYMAHKKVRDFNYLGAGGQINANCDPASGKCLNGDPRWVVRQDYMEK